MDEPRGFLITWTCYGTWLWGDERGSVDDEHNLYGTPGLSPNAWRIAGLRRQMKHPAYRLSEEARHVVTEAVTDHCRVRGWEIHAVNVRSNHVHVVVGFAGVAPEAMMGELKAWASRRLRKLGFAAANQPVWTRHGSTRYLWKERDLDPAIHYVLDGQDAERFSGKVSGTPSETSSEHREQAR